MKVIEMYKDLIALKNSKVFPTQFLNFLECEWKELWEAYNENQTEALTMKYLVDHQQLKI